MYPLNRSSAEARSSKRDITSINNVSLLGTTTRIGVLSSMGGSTRGRDATTILGGGKGGGAKDLEASRDLNLGGVIGTRPGGMSLG